MAHEFGHMLGSTLHDDEFYPEERADELLMWSVVRGGGAGMGMEGRTPLDVPQVNDRANVWSDRAQKAISSHNTSCLAR
jgi:hypothetical protein